MEVMDKLPEGEVLTFSLTPKGDKLDPEGGQDGSEGGVQHSCGLCGIRIGAGQNHV